MSCPQHPLFLFSCPTPQSLPDLFSLPCNNKLHGLLCVILEASFCCDTWLTLISLCSTMPACTPCHVQLCLISAPVWWSFDTTPHWQDPILNSSLVEFNSLTDSTLWFVCESAIVQLNNFTVYHYLINNIKLLMGHPALKGAYKWRYWYILWVILRAATCLDHILYTIYLLVFPSDVLPVLGFNLLWFTEFPDV